MKEKYIEMVDSIIKKFGFEDMHTIIFCGLVECGADEQTIYETYDEYMDLPVIDEEDE